MKPAKQLRTIEGPARGLPLEQRDLACRDALDPALAALAGAAINAGWHPAEVAAAMLGHAVDAIRGGAGADAAMASVQSVMDFLKRERNGEITKR